MANKMQNAITDSERAMVVNAIRAAGHGNVNPENVQTVINTNGSVIYVVPVGDAMACYTPEFATEKKTGVKFICF